MKTLPILLCVLAVTLLLLWWSIGFALPIFCTTRGCVTTNEWSKGKEYHHAFANVAHSSAPSETAILTTLVRKHLITNAQKSGATEEDAVKYRTDVLHLTSVEHIQQLGFSSFAEYDRSVTVPFLLQQAYMNEHGIKDPKEAYIALSQDFRVVSLLFHYTWDTSKGEVRER